MQHKLSIAIAASLLFLGACRTNPNRAEKLDLALAQSDAVTGQEQVGVHKGEMVVQDQVMASERLRDLQNQVFSLEDKVYGTRKLGTEGLYGKLRVCRRKLASKAYGGDGSFVWDEPLDRVTDKDEDLSLGLNDRGELVGLSREYLRDRLTRFSGYRLILQKRADEFGAKVETCEAELKERTPDPKLKADAEERAVTPDAKVERARIDEFMCGFVRKDASLRDLMLTSFVRGWLALTDFKSDQNLMAARLKDHAGEERANALLFNGWKLAFDQSSVTLSELFTSAKDAKLVAWTAEKTADPKSCLKRGEGLWNP